jgi:hypothetical protein
MPRLCKGSGGAPDAALVRLACDRACSECHGDLDEGNRPVHRYPLPPGAEVRVIVLVDDDEVEGGDPGHRPDV